MARNDEAAIRAAAAKYGPSIDRVAKQYGLSGATLLVKLAKGESGFRGDAVSSAGARGWTQFMPATRASYVQKYGVDPWASPDQAVHATALYLKGSGNVAAYNPGDPSYTKYILGQQVGHVPSSGGGGSSGGGAGGGGSVTLSTGGGSTQPADTGGGIDAAVALLQAAGQQKPVIQSAGLQAPAFSARPVMPQGAQLPQGGGGPAAPASSAVDQGLALVAAAQGQGATPQTSTAPVSKTIALGGTTGSQKGDLATEATARANAINAQQLPYQWGGGHAGRVTNYAKTQPLDCSGAVSAVLGINPRVSGQFKTWGRPGDGGSKGVTVYAKDTHVLMKIDGHFFGTSSDNPGGGAGWVPASKISPEYLKGFTVRHSNR